MKIHIWDGDKIPLSLHFTPFAPYRRESRPKVRKSVSEKAYFDRSFVTDDAQLCAALHLEMPRWSETLVAFTRSGGYGYLLDRLSKITQQALIIWGKHDRILGIEAAEKFTQRLLNSQLQWIDNCGHVPHLEMAQITAQLILDFVNSPNFGA